MDENCVFCKITAISTTPSSSPNLNALSRSMTSTPPHSTHVLVVPREHIVALRDLADLTLGAELLGLAHCCRIAWSSRFRLPRHHQ